MDPATIGVAITAANTRGFYSKKEIRGSTSRVKDLHKFSLW